VSRTRNVRSCVPSLAPEVGAARRATFCVGLVHGLAGSAAIALLLLASQPSRSTAVGYLFMFGAGSVAGMVALTLALLLPLGRLASRLGTQARFSSLVPSLLSMGLGAAILFNTFRDCHSFH
jgi:nickel/cobalt transporter (NicO) family protein